jgi:DNA-binding response OmpR family regulator
LHQNDESSITRSNKGPFRILLVDDERDITSVTKRGLTSNGFELYKHIYKIDDKIGVCFLSAFESYSEEFRITFPKLSAICFIRKPISIDELANKIKEQLLQEPIP